jgi:hypothetical protein
MQQRMQQRVRRRMQLSRKTPQPFSFIILLAALSGGIASLTKTANNLRER